jgi:transposase-like protein
MHRYSDAFKAEVRRRMRQSVVKISAQLRIQIVTLYNWSKECRS